MINYIHHVDVPHYSQFQDVTSVEWRKEACGIAAMAMEIEFYNRNTVSVDKMLDQALASGAHVPGIGWNHAGLAALAGKYGLVGKTHDFTKLDKPTAFEGLKEVLKGGPLIASIYNKFIPGNPLGHLVVVTGFDDEFVFYNDPAAAIKEERKISTSGFLAGWKKRIITVREQPGRIATKSAQEPVIAQPALEPQAPVTPDIPDSAPYSLFAIASNKIGDSLRALPTL